MTEAERQEFKAMVTDVAILKHSNEKIIEPTLKKINDKLDKLNFYTKAEVDAKIRQVQKRRWYENTLSAAFGALLTTVLLYLVNKLIDGGQ